MEILDEKVNAHLPYYSTLKKFWNGFFQTFQAGLLFFSGGNHFSFATDKLLLFQTSFVTDSFTTQSSDENSQFL